MCQLYGFLRAQCISGISICAHCNDVCNTQVMYDTNENVHEYSPDLANRFSPRYRSSNLGFCCPQHLVSHHIFLPNDLQHTKPILTSRFAKDGSLWDSPCSCLQSLIGVFLIACSSAIEVSIHFALPLSGCKWYGWQDPLQDSSGESTLDKRHLTKPTNDTCQI